MVTSMYCNVNNTGPRVYTFLQWHIKHLSVAVSTPQYVHMHERKHAWNDGAAATAREADAVARRSARRLHSTQTTTLSYPIASTALYLLPETPIPLNIPSPFPKKTQNSSQTAGKCSFTVPTMISFQSAQLWRSSMQLHNGPLRNCRTTRGKAAVQQSPSRRARRRPSPKMHDVADREKQSVNAEQPKPTAAHHIITTACHPDNTHSSALVRSQSTRSMAGSGCKPRRQCSETRFTFLPFSLVFL